MNFMDFSVTVVDHLVFVSVFKVPTDFSVTVVLFPNFKQICTEADQRIFAASPTMC